MLQLIQSRSLENAGRRPAHKILQSSHFLEQTLDVNNVFLDSIGPVSSYVASDETSATESLFILTKYMKLKSNFFQMYSDVQFDLQSSKPIILFLCSARAENWRIYVRSTALTKVIAVGGRTQTVKLISGDQAIDTDSISVDTYSGADGSWAEPYAATHYPSSDANKIIERAQEMTGLQVSYLHACYQASRFQYKGVGATPTPFSLPSPSPSPDLLDSDVDNVILNCFKGYHYVSPTPPSSNASLFVLGIEKPLHPAPFANSIYVDFSYQSDLPIHLVLFSSHRTDWKLYVRSKSLIRVTVVGGRRQLHWATLELITDEPELVSPILHHEVIKYSPFDLAFYPQFNGETLEAIEEMTGLKLQHFHSCWCANNVRYKSLTEAARPSTSPSPSGNPQPQLLLDAESAKCRARKGWSWMPSIPPQDGKLFIFASTGSVREIEIEFSYTSDVPVTLVLSAQAHVMWKIKVQSSALKHVIVIGNIHPEIELTMGDSLEGSRPWVEAYSKQRRASSGLSPLTVTYYSYMADRFISSIEMLTGLKANFVVQCPDQTTFHYHDINNE